MKEVDYVTVKEIEQEGWINLESFSKYDDIPNYEIASMVVAAYKYESKLKKGKMNEQLKKRYDSLDTFEREINTIQHIYIVRNSTLNDSNEINDYIVIEDLDGIKVLLEVTTGKDLSHHNIDLQVIPSLTKVEEIYETPIDKDNLGITLAIVKKVTYHTNTSVFNTFNNKELTSSSILEIEDTVGNKLYIDVLLNEVFYGRERYHLKFNNKHKEIPMFERNTSIKLGKKILSIKEIMIRKIFERAYEE